MIVHDFDGKREKQLGNFTNIMVESFFLLFQDFITLEIQLYFQQCCYSAVHLILYVPCTKPSMQPNMQAFFISLSPYTI